MKTNWKRYLCNIIIILCCIICYLVLKAFTFQDYSMDNIYELDGGWTVEADNKVYKNFNLSTDSIKMQNKGDVVVMKHKLNKTYIPNASLLMYSIHSAVTVKLDDNVIYNYGYKDAKEGNLLGYGYHFINIPDSIPDCTLTVIFHVTENNAFQGLPGMKIQDTQHILRQMINDGRVKLAVSVFLISFGIVCSIVCVLILGRQDDYYQPIFIALAGLLIGVWTMCNSDLIEIFTPNLKVKVYVEYISFYSVPIPLSLYFRSRLSAKEKYKKMSSLISIILVIQCISFIASVICNMTNLIHFPSFLKLEQVMIGLVILEMFIFFALNSFNGSINSSAINIGLILAGVMVIYELIKFNLCKYLLGFTNNEFITTICFAALIIVVTMLMDFAQQIADKMYDAATQSALKQMAYQDFLTGLGNRAKLEEESDLIDDTREDYAIISLDMNNLKLINDTFGHEEGDNAIVTFSNILKECFGDIGSISRTGGDEFIVIIRNKQLSMVNSSIEKMLNALDQANNINAQYTLSTAYGLVYKNSLGSNARFTDLLRKADELMYQNKIASKQARSN